MESRSRDLEVAVRSKWHPKKKPKDPKVLLEMSEDFKGPRKSSFRSGDILILTCELQGIQLIGV